MKLLDIARTIYREVEKSRKAGNHVKAEILNQAVFDLEIIIFKSRGEIMSEQWEEVISGQYENTKRLKVDGGYIYKVENSGTHENSIAMVFVPFVEKIEIEKPEIKLGESIHKLDLTVRSKNWLLANGIKHINELCSVSERELIRCPNFGKRSLAKIKNVLAERGLTLRDE